ncbi:MAG: hypothetical protein WBJ68_13665, partial [Candidatus Dechloromonas phosphoritropha]
RSFRHSALKNQQPHNNYRFCSGALLNRLQTNQWLIKLTAELGYPSYLRDIHQSVKMKAASQRYTVYSKNPVVA